MNVTDRLPRSGQYTVDGAGRSTPSWRMSATTPMTSLHGSFGFERIRLPIAAAAEPQYSRAKFSLISTTSRFWWMSVQSYSRPAVSGVPSTWNVSGTVRMKRRSGGIWFWRRRCGRWRRSDPAS